MITPDLLCSHPLFQSLNREALEGLALVAADVHLLEDEWLIYEGELPSFYVLLKGDLQATKRIGGVEQDLYRFNEGDFLGEVPLLLGSTHSINLRALNDVRVLRLEATDFHQMMDEYPEIAAQVRQKMQQRLTFIQQITTTTPIRVPLIIGSRNDVDCHHLRRFCSENQVNFRWLDPGNPASARMIPKHLADGPYPIVVLGDGSTTLYGPSTRDVAEKLGLQTAPEQSCYDLVIIGGGPAGLAAAVYGSSEGLKTLMIDREAPGGQAGSSSRIENYLGFPSGLSGGELAARALQQAKRFGTEILVTREVTEICCDGLNHRVILDGKDAVSAKTVILSTGVSWRSMSVPGIEKHVNRGVFYGASRMEAINVRGKEIYLIGGGNSAGQSALYFSSFAHRVTLLIRADSIEKGMSHYLINQLRTKENIEVQLETRVVEVHGEDRMEGISVETGDPADRKRYETDSLFILIGADAETEWLCQEVGRDDRGYVLTGLDAQNSGKWRLERDPYLLETSVPGIFAAGDVRHGSIKRVASGVGEGSMAVAFIHQYLAQLGEEPS